MVSEALPLRPVVAIEQEVSAWKTLHRAYDRGSVRLTEPRLADRTKVRNQASRRPQFNLKIARPRLA